MTRWDRYAEIDRLHRLASGRGDFVGGDIPWTERPWGCECGAGLHEGETHEAALLCEAVEASTGCTCGGYLADDDSGDVVHLGTCPAGDEPGPVYQLTEIGHGRVILRGAGLSCAGARL
ncbi:MAG: hypothetical protein VW547_13015 [Alphaproteobacteria bacterium]